MIFSGDHLWPRLRPFFLLFENMIFGSVELVRVISKGLASPRNESESRLYLWPFRCSCNEAATLAFFEREGADETVEGCL